MVMTFSKKRLGYVGAALSAAVCLTGLGATELAAPASPLAASQATFTPGAPGLGDPYFPREGNGGYDVSHYDLKLTYIPKAHHLGGTATITATATQNLSRFDLDLTNFKVSSLKVNTAEAGFTRHGQELVVTPRHGLAKGRAFTVVVAYAGTPHTILNSPIVFGAPYGWIYTKDGAFVGCEPNAAHTWYPSNDHPSDKATFRFDITVPTGTQVVANGDQTGGTSNGGMNTFVWTEREPMATYLATIDIGKWNFHNTRTSTGIPETVAVDPALENQAESDRVVKLTGDVTDYWAKLFGRYPFSSTGGIVDHVPNIGFSLETQTRPLYGFVPDSVTASHELAHQWFGDSLSVKTWQNIWLNEGFATFASWLWAEHRGGDTTYAYAKRIFTSIRAGSKFWKQSIADPKRNTMFSQAVYYRGAMTLASLRHRIGDQKFFQLLKTWATTYRYGNVTTPEFTNLASRVSGQNLDRFFHTWLWKQAKPPAI